MFGSIAIEVAIGLALVFMLTSLLVSAFVESIEGLLKTRAENLERAILVMLREQTPRGKAKESSIASLKVLQNLYEHPAVFTLFDGPYRSRISSSLSERYFLRMSDANLPSYIPREMFSTAILDLDQRGKTNPAVSSVLEAFRQQYGDDLAATKASVEMWYDSVMERASGWYKRRTQIMLFFVGLVMAGAMNINPIAIGQYLALEPEARAEIVDIAVKTVEERSAQPVDDSVELARATAPAEEDNAARPDPSDPKALQEELSKLQKVGLPIGWSEFSRAQAGLVGDGSGLAWLFAILGWLITALATTLGAPFWFDALSKLVVVRSTMKPLKTGPAPAPPVGASVGPTGEASAAPEQVTLPAAASDYDDAADGCQDQDDLGDQECTNDIELPPARGGVERE